MSVRYVAVNWNRQKRVYDLVLSLGVVLLLGSFVAISMAADAHMTPETAMIRGLGLTALLLLHLVLCIGPLCRLNPAFLPLLYNRRHLGVAMAFLALGHAGFATFQFHALGDLHPLVSVLSSNQAVGSLAGFPFELLGLAALVILVLMAATSHDFWLATLGPPAWKALHMLVYVAYALLVGHVALGSMQADTGSTLPVFLAAGGAVVIGLHLAAGFRERRVDRSESGTGEWIPACRVADIPEKRARIAVIGGERVAVFRADGRLSCVSNVCRHQNGPLGEGRIVDGCITCPWHGYQYRPETGTSPPPFNDKVATYDLRVENGVVLVRCPPHPPGTPVAQVSAGVSGETSEPDTPFYVGYSPKADPALARHTARFATLLLAGGAAVMLILALAQPPLAAASFEYGHPRTLTGSLVPGPYPSLEVTSDSGVTRYLLAATGKHGAASLTTNHGENRVTILGTLIRRGNASMLEIASISSAGEGGPASRPEQVDLGRFTLTGEIVDSKCWLGVMNPGEGKTHLSCAVRCLSGGLTPLFVIRDSTGAERHLILTSETGGPMPRSILPAVGRPVRISGRVVREGDFLFLEAAPASVERVR